MLSTIYSLMIFLSGFGPVEKPEGFRLPETWESNFTIAINYTELDGSTTDLTFKHDFARYIVRRNGENPEVKVFAMTPEIRAELLAELKKLKPEKIKIEGGSEEGWKRSICFGDNCMIESAGAKMDSNDKAKFSQVFSFMIHFALEKKKEIENR